MKFKVVNLQVSVPVDMNDMLGTDLVGTVCGL